MALVLELARLAHEFHDAEVGVVIDKQRSLVNRRHCGDNLLDFVRTELAVAEPTLVHLRLRAKQTLGELDAVHFQAEKGNVLAVANGCICGNRHRERCFTHTRTGCENDQVGILETVREFIQFRNARRHARNAAITTVVDAFQKRRHKVVDRLQGVAHLVIGNRKDVAFGILQHIVRRRSRVHRLADNIG